MTPPAAPEPSQPLDPALSTTRGLPQPVVTRSRWPYVLVWVAPVLAAIGAGIYFRMSARARGPEVIVTFADASGLRPNETIVSHRGVQLGTVRGLSLSDDGLTAEVRIQLRQDATSFARAGAQYWVVRPTVSLQNISGLGTLASGPYVEATPGTGDPTDRIPGASSKPEEKLEGLGIVLYADRLERVQPSAPLLYRGVEVGKVRTVRLSADSRGVEARALIYPAYAPLIRKNTKFWAIKPADFKGGLFSGVEFKLGSLQTLVTGGVEFATPTEAGPVADEGQAFTVVAEPEKKWMDWAPIIRVETPDGDGAQLPKGSAAINAVTGRGEPAPTQASDRRP